MTLLLRAEQPDDIDAIRTLVDAAFAVAVHSNGAEGAIVEALREAGALSLSWVALLDGERVGHIGFSPVRIDGQWLDWYGLGPLSVRPDLHRRGIGTALVRQGLAQLRERRARGCVVLGDPHYYPRFGFTADPALCYPGVPAEYFMALRLDGAPVSGVVDYHPAFFSTGG